MSHDSRLAEIVPSADLSRWMNSTDLSPEEQGKIFDEIYAMYNLCIQHGVTWTWALMYQRALAAARAPS